MLLSKNIHWIGGQTTIYYNGEQRFIEFDLKLPGFRHNSKLFQCLSCKNYFVSKNGAQKHNCHIQNLNDQLTTDEKERFAMRHLLRHIAINNIPFHTVHCTELQMSYQAFDRKFVIPNKDTLRTKMIILANEIKEEMIKKIANQTVSLMIDGSSR